MPLSRRAIEYLQHLERRKTVETSAVRALLSERIIVTPESWLAFHDLYAGYVEVIGLEKATLGLVHENPRWLPRMLPEIEEDGPTTLLIACADVHPSYDYWLDQDGEFLGLGAGGPCERFEVHIEQFALLSSTRRATSWKRVHDFAKLPQEEKGEILEKLSSSLIPEASDRYTECFFSEEALIMKRLDSVEMLARGELLGKIELILGSSLPAKRD